MKEYWQITHERGQQTIGVWGEFNAGFAVKKVTLTTHTADVNSLPGLAQTRDGQQTVLDTADKKRADALAGIVDVATRVPHVIENNLDADDDLQDDLHVIYAIEPPLSEAPALNRARKVIALWTAVNAARAAMAPPLPPVVLNDAALADFITAVEGYPALQQDVVNADAKLSKGKSALRVATRRTDGNNKRWYDAWKNFYQPGDAAADALSRITTEDGTSKPAALGIAALTPAAGGHLTVDYGPGAGVGNATTAELQTRLVGTESEFGHSVPVALTGQTVGPFPAGVTVEVRTRLANSAGVSLGPVKGALVA